jgi:hypothetical protein
MIVSGGPGSGKSALLRYFRHEAGKNGMLAPYVKVEKGESETALSEKIFHEAAMLSGLERSGPPPGGLDKTFQALGRFVRKGFGAVVLIDDLDLLRKADGALGRIAAILKEGWGRREVAVVVSTTREMDAGAELSTMVALRPFGEHEAREMVEKALKKGPPKMGDECLNSILSDSGGNPRLIKSLCRMIYERLRDNEKVITKGHYLAYLPQMMSALSREWFGRMYQETPTAERLILHALARSEDGMHVSDVARTLDRPLGPVTALTRRLLDSGQIVRVDRGKYRVFSKLYARYVNQRG